LLDFARAQTMPRDVDDVVRATENEKISFGVLVGIIEGGVELPLAELSAVVFFEELVISPDRAHAAGRQRQLHREHAFLAARDSPARRRVNDLRVITVARISR